MDSMRFSITGRSRSPSTCEQSIHGRQQIR
jgi:hypothetical protein